MRIVLLAVAMAWCLNGCGQKGALYLRDNPPPNIKPPKADPYKPVPYPRELAPEAPSGEEK